MMTINQIVLGFGAVVGIVFEYIIWHNCQLFWNKNVCLLSISIDTMLILVSIVFYQEKSKFSLKVTAKSGQWQTLRKKRARTSRKNMLVPRNVTMYVPLCASSTANTGGRYSCIVPSYSCSIAIVIIAGGTTAIISLKCVTCCCCFYCCGCQW